MPQATLTLTGPGWTYPFKNLKMLSLWHSKQRETPRSSEACLAADLTALTPCRPLRLPCYCLGSWVQLQPTAVQEREILSPSQGLGNSRVPRGQEGKPR